MSRPERLLRKPDYRVPMAIPTNWCLSCQLTLRTVEEYQAHIRIFPTHNIKPISKLVCPKCGMEVELEGGRYSEHRIGFGGRKCSGSGTEA